MKTPKRKPSSKPRPVGEDVSAVAIKGQPSQPQPRATANRRVDLQSVFAALMRHWLLAGSLGIVGAVLAGGLTWLLVSPARYTARTMLHIDSQTPKLAFATENRGDTIGYRQTQKTMAKSRLVLSHALDQPSVSSVPTVQDLVRRNRDPLEWLEKELKADYTAGSEILTIALNGDNPEDLKIIVDGIRASYLEKVANRERADRLGQLGQIEELYNNYQNTLRRKEQELKQLARTVGSSDVPTVMIKQQFVAERLGVVQRELIKVQSDLRTLHIKIQEMQSHQEDRDVVPIPDPVLEEWLRKHPLVAAQRLEVTQIEEELEKAKKVATEKTLISYRQRLDAARGKLLSLESDLRPKAIESLRDEIKRRSKSSLAELLDQQAFLKKLEASLMSEIKQFEQQSETLNLGSVEVEVLRRDVAQIEGVTKKLGEQKEALRVELEAPPRVQVLEEATVSRTYNERKQLLATGGAALAVLGLVAFGAVAWEFRTQRITNPDDVVTGAGIPLLGTIPQLASPVDYRQVEAQPLLGQSKPLNQLTEAADAMRAVLIHGNNVGDPRVIVVTSALPGEGKTALSCHLAISLARAGRRTVLVDSDLRRSAVHRVFGLPQEPGLQEALRSDRSVESVMQATSVPNLSIMTAGGSTGHPAQVLSSDRLQAVISGLRRLFDYVIIDSCPVLLVADTLVVGEHADGVILSVMHGHSCLPHVQAAYKKISSVGMHVFGGVLNGAAPGIGDYDYQYQPKPAPAEMGDLEKATGNKNETTKT